MEEEVNKACEILKDGGIVIFPTDTAFGIGCRMDDVKAIEKLFKIRKRPQDQATSILVSSIKMAEEYLKVIPKDVKAKLMDKYWPGALTIVLPAILDKVSSLVRGGGDTLGVRMPDNDIILKLIKGVGVPILGPSANFHGGKAPYKASDLPQNLVKLVDYVIPGETKFQEASTVVDCTKKPWKILREGAIKLEL